MNEPSSHHLVILGPPGAGKGTQAKLLANRLDLKHIASGDLFRHHLSHGSSLGLQAKKYMDAGVLVPDEVTINMALEEVLTLQSGRGFILDGFPRNLYQAQRLDDALVSQELHLNTALLIVVPKEELIRRLANRWLCRDCQAPYQMENIPGGPASQCSDCGGVLYQRDDDRPEAISTRLEVYEAETSPLAEYYEGAGMLRAVQGVGAVEDVQLKLIEALGPTEARLRSSS